MDKFIHAKDQRYQEIQRLLTSYQMVISIRSNIPGIDKHINEAYLLCRVFFHVLNKQFHVKSHVFLDGFDGPYVLLILKNIDAMSVKTELINIEASHPLGRFIDLDLYMKNHVINRKALGFLPRKCYLCHEIAYVCARERKHQDNELIAYIKRHVKRFIMDDIYHQIDVCIMKELDLEDKFGLVTKTSSGSHEDMNYAMMVSSKHAIMPYLIRMFESAYDNPNHPNLLSEARIIGKKAEQAMLDVTGGINTYKGLIFVLGFMLLGIGIDLNKKFMNESIFEDIKQLSEPIKSDFNQVDETFGLSAFRLYGIKGARGEIMNGFPTLKYLKNVGLNHITGSDEDYIYLLKEIITHAEDTVLLKRAGSYEKYLAIKKDMASINHLNIKEVKDYTAYCVKNKLSFGGSADLLITYLLWDNYKNQYSIPN